MSHKIAGRILAIDPGTRYLGFALLEGGQLLHHGVKALRRVESPETRFWQANRVVTGLIADFRPQRLVVEKTFFANNRNAAPLNALAMQITVIGKRKRLGVESLAANTVRRIICGNGSASKDDVARVVVARFPELRPYLTSNRKWKDLYHRNMFDAVALALASESPKK